MTSVRFLPHESVLFSYKTAGGTFPFWFKRSTDGVFWEEIPREEVIAKMQELVPIDHPNGHMVVEGLRWVIEVAKPSMVPRMLDYRNNGHVILGLEKYIADGEREGVHPSYPFLESGWVRYFNPVLTPPTVPPFIFDEELPPSPPTPDEIEDDEAPTANDGAVLSGGGYVPYPTADFLNLLKNEVAKRLGVNADQIVYRIETRNLSDGIQNWQDRNEYCYLLNVVNLGGLGINFYDWYLSDSPINWAKHGNAIFFNKLKSVGKGVVYYVEFSCH